MGGWAATRHGQGALHSEAELVEHYGVSRMTVRNSFSILTGEGLVHAEHGKGVFVRPRPPVRRLASDRFARRHREQGKSAFIAEADAAGSHPQVDSLEVKEEKASQDISTRLGSVRRVLARRRRYLLDGRPVEFATSYLPLDIARGTPIAEPTPPAPAPAPAPAASTPVSKSWATTSTTSRRRSAPGCLRPPR